MIDFYQIYYRDEQREACFPFAKLHFNESLTIFFENSVIAELVMSSKSDKVSVCSWKLREKLRWNVGRCREITPELLESDYEVLSFTKQSPHHDMLAAADKWHPGFMYAFKKIVEGIGEKMPNKRVPPIYQNHFAAKRDIYQDYIATYLRPAMWLINNDAVINGFVMADSNYSQIDKKAAVKSDYLMDQIGVPYYPLAPFLLERLFSVYCYNKNINVSWL